ncbi:MAG: Ku protein [Clostridiales bacterium]|jgi:DNA end-binding protein Ku|nr:Ku protein [Clostridiales bacterium]
MAIKSAISFGLVHIPVSLHTTVKDVDVHFNQLHKEDNARIRYKKVCERCGKEVKADGIAKGYEYEKGRYVIISDEDIERIKTEKDKTLQIIHFTSLIEINPIYLDKAYYASVDAGGEKAFELLRRVMMDEKKVAIAKTVLGAREALMALMPTETGIICQTMFFQDEVKEQPITKVKGQVSEEELKMAKTLVASMAKPFEAADYKDEYQSRLRQLIEGKIAGNEISAPSSPSSSNNVIDLMEALQQSISQVEEPKKAVAKRKPRSKKAAGA